MAVRFVIVRGGNNDDNRDDGDGVGEGFSGVVVGGGGLLRRWRLWLWRCVMMVEVDVVVDLLMLVVGVVVVMEIVTLLFWLIFNVIDFCCSRANDADA